MKRVLVVPWSIAAAYFAFAISAPFANANAVVSSSRNRLGGEDPVVRQSSEHAADDRAEHRDPCVRPVRRSLSGNGQDEVHDAWSEVARWVDRVTGGTAQREADRKHEQADEQRRYARRGGRLVAADRQHAEEQHESPDHLGDQVEGVVADRRPGREDGELQSRVIRLFEAVGVSQEDEKGPDHCADEFSGDVNGYVTPWGHAD